MTPISGEKGCCCSSRSTWTSAFALTSSGMPAASIFSRSSLATVCLGAGLAQLLLDGAQLLAQVVLALLLVHPGLRFGLDLLAQVEHVEPLLDQHAQAAQALDRIEDLQQLLALVGRELGREGDQVGQPARLFDAAHHRQHLFRHVRKHADVVLDLLHHRGHRRFRFGGRIDRVVLPDDARDEIRILLHQLGDDAAGEPLQDDMAAAARAGTARSRR